MIENQPLKDLNWWKVGGTARYFSQPSNIEELKEAFLFGHRNKLPVWILSGGSNVLIQDGVLDGVVISMRGLKTVDAPVIGEDSVEITCEAGTPKSEIAKIFLQSRLPPAVFLTGIPGDMGAGVVMNAGIGEMRTPREFCEIVERIEVLRLNESDEKFEVVEINGKDLIWEYRHCQGWQPGVITKVTVKWANKPDANVPNDVRAQTRKRVSTQPLDLPSCGSVFRNPLGHKSAQLIESCGLKGFRIGGASVSTKHANFIVNDKDAEAKDIHRLIRHVQKTVEEKTGVRLQTEVVYIGDWNLNDSDGVSKSS